jgi:hypothetical protein
MAKRQSSPQVGRDSSYFTRLGMETELQRLEERAAQLRAWLAKLPGRAAAAVRRVAGADRGSSPSTGRRRRRKMTAEARQRISDAQKARWAKQRGEQSASAQAQAAAAGATAGAGQGKRRGRGATKAAAKRGRRKMSAAARRRISNAQKRRWAAKRKAA